ncbi:MAG: hypothetical protein FWC41_05300 [Firmicutes bacterium]|nr:hypothetical protein [Bacillota bacterium]
MQNLISKAEMLELKQNFLSFFKKETITVYSINSKLYAQYSTNNEQYCYIIKLRNATSDIAPVEVDVDALNHIINNIQTLLISVKQTDEYLFFDDDLRIKTYPSNDLPLWRVDGDLKYYSKLFLGSIFKKCSSFMSDDEFRANMRGVNLQCSENQITASATTNMIALITSETCKSKGEGGTVFIPINAVKIAEKMKGLVTITIKGKHSLIANDTIKILTKSDESFPKIEQIIPAKEFVAVRKTIYVNDMLQHIERLRRLWKKKGKITLDFLPNRTEITGINDIDAHFVHKVIGKNSGQDFKIQFNINNLYSILKHAKDNAQQMLEFSFTDINRVAAIFNKNSTVLIMPTKMKESEQENEVNRVA